MRGKLAFLQGKQEGKTYFTMEQHGAPRLPRFVPLCLATHHQLSSYIVRTTLTELELLDGYGSVAAVSSLMVGYSLESTSIKAKKT